MSEYMSELERLRRLYGANLSDPGGMVRSEDGFLENPPNAYERIGETLNDVGDFSYEMTGIPLAERGIEDLQQTDDPWAQARGAGELGLAALPFAGPLARAAFATAPRAIAAGGAYGVIPNLVTEAEAAKYRKKQGRPARRSVVRKREGPAPAPEPVVRMESAAPVDPNAPPDLISLAAQRDPRIKIDAEEKKRLERIIDMETNSKGGFGERAQAAQDELKQVNARLQKSIEPFLPFDQAYPGPSANWSALQFGVPAVAALATRGVGRAFANEGPRRFNQAVRQGESAFDGGMFRKPDLALADRKLAEVKGRLKNFREPGFMERQMVDSIMPAGAGAVLGAEMSVFPEQYNKRNTLPGTPENKLANERLAPDKIFDTMKPGAIMGAMGGLTATHVAPGWRVTADKERAEAFTNRMGAKDSPAAKAKARDIEAARNVDVAGKAPDAPLAKEPKAPLKPKDKWWNATISKMRKSQTVHDAVRLLDTDPDLAKLNTAKRRRIVTDVIQANPNASPQDVAKALRKRVTSLKKSGKFYSGAIGASLAARTIAVPGEEDE